MRLSRPHPALLTALLSAGLVLSGCTDDVDPGTDDASSEQTTASTPTDPTSPPTSASAASAPTLSASTEPAPTMTASETGEVDLTARLLPASQVGRLNTEWRWTAATDFDTEPRRLVACHRAALIDIGAQEVAVREYTSDLDANAAAFLLVAATPDEETGRRLYTVLESWQSDCQRRLEARAEGRGGVKVTDLVPVDAGPGPAATYEIFQPTPTDSARIENVGIALEGRVVTVAVIKIEGQDFNYPRGRTPAAVTLRNAASG